MSVLSSFTLPNVVPNLYAFLSSVEFHNIFYRNIEFNGDHQLFGYQLLQNIFFCAHRKSETYTGLKQLDQSPSCSISIQIMSIRTHQRTLHVPLVRLKYRFNPFPPGNEGLLFLVFTRTDALLGWEVVPDARRLSLGWYMAGVAIALSIRESVYRPRDACRWKRRRLKLLTRSTCRDTNAKNSKQNVSGSISQIWQ